MSDIHILDGTYDAGRSMVSKRYAMHFLVAASLQVVAAASDPTLASFASIVPNIAASELVAIQAGCIVERAVTDQYHTQDAPSTVLARMRIQYNSLVSPVETEYVHKYTGYLQVKSSS